MRRRTALPCLLLTAFLAAPATSHAALVGFSEQQPAMFSNPLYQALTGVKIARYVAPWDVASNARDRAIFTQWIAGARAQGDKVLVSFYLERDKPLRVPSVKQYTAAIKAFNALFPDVESISPWNEANKRAPGRFANPSAKRAAQYYEVARKVFKGKKIVGLDVLDQANIKPSLIYVKQFLRAVKHRPKIWGLHNYSDTNRFRNKGTKAILKLVKGDVWLTETGGIVRFGRSFPYDEARAAKALKFMFKLAKSNARLKRLYIYQWTGAPRGALFDAGLVGADGATTRPGYEVVAQKLA